MVEIPERRKKQKEGGILAYLYFGWGVWRNFGGMASTLRLNGKRKIRAATFLMDNSSMKWQREVQKVIFLKTAESWRYLRLRLQRHGQLANLAVSFNPHWNCNHLRFFSFDKVLTVGLADSASIHLNSKFRRTRQISLSKACVMLT